MNTSLIENYMPKHPLHLPIAHIDLQRICHNFNALQKLSNIAKAAEDQAFAKANLPTHFGKNHADGFVWPSQLAVIKADAYGHGQIEAAHALIKNGAQMFASGSVQECLALREGLGEHINNVVILNLLGPLTTQDVRLCIDNGIIPLIHTQEQLELLKSVTSPLPIAIKCNSGMARLGFNEDELDAVIKNLQSLPNIMPVLAMSHLHSGDTENVKEEIKKQGELFGKMLKSLRAIWPNIAASLANSAGTIFAKDITAQIGPNICRPGIALYGCNPFHNTTLQSSIEGLLPSMWLSAPILTTRKLKKGQGLGYGHSFVAENDLDIAIIACGYADSFSRGLSHKAEVCIENMRTKLVGRVAMQMIAADITKMQNKNPKQAWLLNGPDANGISIEELATTWGTITYEVLCLLGNNVRNFVKFD